jgi:hypothetical protein
VSRADVPLSKTENSRGTNPQYLVDLRIAGILALSTERPLTLAIASETSAMDSLTNPQIRDNTKTIEKVTHVGGSCASPLSAADGSEWGRERNWPPWSVNGLLLDV